MKYLLLLLLCGCESRVRVSVAQTTNAEAWMIVQPATNDHWRTNMVLLTNGGAWWHAGETNFLSITNRPYVALFGTPLIKFTDQEWEMITNYYRHKIVTNDLDFYAPPLTNRTK
jgi:hypothetical protein